MMHRILFSLLCWGLSLPIAVSAGAQNLGVNPNVAFVIGNAKYRDQEPLRNPPNDAELVGATLAKLGFAVQYHNDLTRIGMFDLETRIREVSKKGANTLFVYYSGHGMRSAGGENYLLPVDAVVSNSVPVERDGTPVLKLMDALKAGNPRLAVLVLDACRNNAFTRGTRSATRGLKRDIVEGKNMLVAYSTEDGEVAEDGEGATSAYAQALAGALPKTDLSARGIFERIDDEVREVSRGRQRPTHSSDVRSNEPLLPSRPVTDVTTSAAPPVPIARVQRVEPVAIAPPRVEPLGPDPEEVDWRRIRASWEPADFQAHLDKYPEGQFAASARRELDRLNWVISEIERVRKEREPSRVGEGSRDAARVPTPASSSNSASVPQSQAPSQSPEQDSAASAREGRRARCSLTDNVQIGKNFRDCVNCPELTWIPAGILSTKNALGESISARLSAPIAVGTKELTFAEWDICVSDGACEPVRNADQRQDRKTQPVSGVSWRDAQSYLQWLSSRTQRRYRLLTEMEWEWAYRAESSTPYHWAAQVGKNNANCNGCGSRWDGQRAAPVDSFNRNAWGLADMAGNVAEWVEDCWFETMRVTNSRRSGGTCQHRVTRGGSYLSPPEGVRATSRERSAAATRSSGIGFRVARSAD